MIHDDGGIERTKIKMKSSSLTLYEKVQTLDKQTKTPKGIARARKSYLDVKEGGVGFPFIFVTVLQEAVKEWLNVVESMDGTAATRGGVNLLQERQESNLLQERQESISLKLVLTILKRITIMDTTLDDELAKQGSHVAISKIINSVDGSMLEKDEDQDFVVEIQDLACENTGASFPIRISPYSREELHKRLPISFPILPAQISIDVEEELQEDAEIIVERQGGCLILINQVNIRQSEQKDVGFVMWPSAVALSRWLLFNSDELQHKTIVELGAGCGLVGLVAGKLLGKASKQQQPITTTVQEQESSAKQVIITDFNELVIKNINQNIHLNGIETIAKGVCLDFYKQDPTKEGWIDDRSQINEQADVVLAADVICQPDDAYAAARSIQATLKPGGKAIVVSGDMKHRYGVECFEGACVDLGLKVTKQNVADLYDGELITKSNMEKTSGYVDGMTLTIYTLHKEII